MTFTKERLTELSRRENVGAILGEEIAELARIALASLEAEPVGEVSEQRDGLVMDGTVDLGGASTHRIIKGASKMKRLPLGTKFYTAPPAPVALPSGYSDFEEIWSSSTHPLTQDDEMKDFAWDIWNACRAAMLQGARNHPEDNLDMVDHSGGSNNMVEPVTTAYKLQDGWVACSERMPEKGRTLALFGKRIKEVCANYVDEGYIGDDGEFYFFDWESGPRIDDCHPYDKAIVSHWMYWELPAAPKQE